MFGGWQARLIDDVTGEQIDVGMAPIGTLLLGRHAFDIFAGHWLTAGEPIAEIFNRIPRGVAPRQDLNSNAPTEREGKSNIRSY